MGDTPCCSQTAKGKAKRNTLSLRTSPIGPGNRIIFTGPDGTGDYRSWLTDDTHYVGAKTSPTEGTSDAEYLWRPAWSNPPLWLNRDVFVGGIGWGLPEFAFLRQRTTLRDKQTGILPPSEEFEIIQRYRNPRWKMYPSPDPQVLGWSGYPFYDPARLAILYHQMKN
ncbi:uncharacterized protein C4orf45 homolog isoform X2 [Hemicordylus capensis]|uniref:uncharacterized protein C4orf45 homolog isoform X2 n=1 Tax=Hemicordylus capensis TaxID=884348 RepID=UPI0023029B52|nr:uncharacterized protein C4orf45 homolog isoform X2 [Hemicordylus capensis]